MFHESHHNLPRIVHIDCFWRRSLHQANLYSSLKGASSYNVYDWNIWNHRTSILFFRHPAATSVTRFLESGWMNTNLRIVTYNKRENNYCIITFETFLMYQWYITVFDSRYIIIKFSKYIPVKCVLYKLCFETPNIIANL